MIRELVVNIYLILFAIIFNIMKLLPLKDKVTFVVTFGQNSLFVYNEMRRQDIPYEVIFLKKTSCSYDFKNLTGEKEITFESFNIFKTISSIYHLATSKHVIIDNYYGFLSVINFKENVQCTQLWHAAGAIKLFGLKDNSIKFRTQAALRRFRKVYKKFDRVVVGSDTLSNVFMEAFDIPPERMLRTGIPRTDLFFDKDKQRQIIMKLTKENELLKTKKVILYAPTYRDNELNHFELKIDIDELYKEFKNDYILLLKLHPAVSAELHLKRKYKDFVFDYSKYKDVNELLLITDILISDYSSIPYEFSLLNKPMIFYPYDLESYKGSRGLWGEYEELVPGPIVYSTKEMKDIIKRNVFNNLKVQEFSKKWNTYSNGLSSYNLVKFLFALEQETEKRDVEREVL